MHMNDTSPNLNSSPYNKNILNYDSSIGLQMSPPHEKSKFTKYLKANTINSR